MSGDCRNFCCIENKRITCSTHKRVIHYRTILSKKILHQTELMPMEQLKIAGFSSICPLLHFRQHFHEMIEQIVSQLYPFCLLLALNSPVIKNHLYHFWKFHQCRIWTKHFIVYQRERVRCKYPNFAKESGGIRISWLAV